MSENWPRFDDLTDDQLAAHIKEAVVEREERFRKKADAEGKPFLGRKAIQSRWCAGISGGGE